VLNELRDALPTEELEPVERLLARFENGPAVDGRSKRIHPGLG
jgi:hypothetical protein